MPSVIQRCSKCIEEMAGAMLAGPCIVVAVEERALLGDHEGGGLRVVRLQLDGR